MKKQTPECDADTFLAWELTSKDFYFVSKYFKQLRSFFEEIKSILVTEKIPDRNAAEQKVLFYVPQFIKE